MAPNNYAELSAKMREKPTFGVAEEVIKKDFPLKLPSRTFINLWNTPEISQFRGYQDDLDESEKRRSQAQREKQDIGVAARAAGAQVLPDMNIVHEMLSQQRQQASALGQHMSDLSNINRREMAGMQAEQRAELVRLHAANQEAANRQRIAETALSDLHDMTLAHRGVISELATRQGHVTNNIDARHTTVNNTTNQHMADVNIHNQVMNLMHTHSTWIGAFMQHERLNAEQMQRTLYEHLRRQQEQQPLTIHMMPQPLQQVTVHNHHPPPPPPGAGAIAAPFFAPAPVPVPTTPASTSYQPPPPPAGGSGAVRFDIATPERSKQREAFGPIKTTRSRSRAPWSSSGLDPPPLPAPQRGRRAKSPPIPMPTLTPTVPVPNVTPPAAEERASASAAAAPGAAALIPAPKRMPAPASRGRSVERKPAVDPARPSSARTRSRGGSAGAATVRYPSTGSMAPVEESKKGRSSRSVSFASTARYPSPEPKQQSAEPAARSRSRGRAPGAAVENAPAAAAPGAAGNVLLPTSGDAAKRERAKVAARIKRKQLKAKTLAEGASEGAKTPTKRVRVRAGTGRPRGRPKKTDGPDVPAGSSKTPGVVAAAQEAAEKAPSKSLAARAAARSRVRVVPISSDGSFATRGRGRPRGSLGVKKRAAGGAQRPSNVEL